MTTAEFPLVVFDDAARKRFTPRNIPNLALWLDASQGPKTGGAAQFTAANSEYLSIADNAGLSTGDIDFSIAAWVYLDTEPANTMMVARKGIGTGNQREWTLQWSNTSQRFQFFVTPDGTSGGLVGVSSTATATDTGAWYFVVAWHDSVANTINIQVNNGSVDTTAHTTGVFNSTGSFFLGSSEGTSAFWDGRVSRKLFAKRVWTTAERTWLYNSGSGHTYEEFGNASNDGANLLANLVSYWKLGEVSGTRSDSHGTNHLTDNNTVTWAAGPSLIDAYEGAPVRQWNDRSGNNHNFAQTVAANMPLFKKAIISGRPVLRFDAAVESYLTAAGPDLATNTLTMFAVLSADSDANRMTILGAEATNNAFMLELNSNPTNSTRPNMGAIIPGTFVYVSEVVATLATPRALTYRRTGFGGGTADHKFWFNAAVSNPETNISPDTSYSANAPAKAIGRRSSATQKFDGDIAELLIFTRNLSDAEVKSVHRYLSRKYSLGLAA